MIKNGKAKPRPIKMKIMKMAEVLVVKAKVSAVPRKGAEQGVDRMVVRIPEKKSPLRLSSIGLPPSFVPPGVTNSKSPKRFKLRTKRISIMNKINVGDWS